MEPGSGIGAPIPVPLTENDNWLGNSDITPVEGSWLNVVDLIAEEAEAAQTVVAVPVTGTSSWYRFM
jgi:hypothetical protein